MIVLLLVGLRFSSNVPAARNRPPVIIFILILINFFYRAYLSTSGGGQTDGFPRRSRSSAGEAYQLGMAA